MARVILAPTDTALLEALARFRLLTPHHAERLGIANITHVRERFKFLRTAGLVHVTERGRLAGPNVYVLSPRGAATLKEWSEGRIATTGRKERLADTEHLGQRIAIVDVHIALRQWAETIGATVNWVQVEFDPNPASLAPVTSATHGGVRYDPDMVASVTTQDGDTWLFAIEVETGGRESRLGNFRSKLEARLLALHGNILEHAIAWPKENRRSRMLFVFKTDDMLQRARQMVDGFTHDTLQSQLRRVFMASLPLDFGEWWNDGQISSAIKAIRKP